MTTLTEEPRYADRIVVVFDMASSSGVIEEMELAKDLKAFRNLLIAIKKFLRASELDEGFQVYKFIGDGWILLFDPTTSGVKLLKFLTRLCKLFKREFSRRIGPELEIKPSSVGLTFGIAKGQLLKIRMLKVDEYIGRPLIIASRLQGAIRDRDKRPEYKALLTRRAFLQLKPPARYNPKAVTRTLRNIRGGAPFQCVKIRIPV